VLGWVGFFVVVGVVFHSESWVGLGSLWIGDHFGSGFDSELRFSQGLFG
jgi:hypothetical protein